MKDFANFSEMVKMHLNSMAEIEKEKWNSLHCATCCMGILHKVAAPDFFVIYIIQLCKEDWQSCGYAGLSGYSSF